MVNNLAYIESNMTDVNLNVSKQAYSIRQWHEETEKRNDTKRGQKINKSRKWIWFRVNVKIEQINKNLFSDTVQTVAYNVKVNNCANDYEMK